MGRGALDSVPLILSVPFPRVPPVEDATAHEPLPESPDAIAASTAEVRAAHDVLAELYATRLADALDRMPVDRAVLGLFCELTRSAGVGDVVGDIGCGSGRLAPYLAAQGLVPRGVDLSPGSTCGGTPRRRCSSGCPTPGSSRCSAAGGRRRRTTWCRQRGSSSLADR